MNNVAADAHALQLVIALERLRALVRPLRTMRESLTEVLDIAPELDPEMNCVADRIIEAMGHIEAAQAVVTARIELLREPS